MATQTHAMSPIAIHRYVWDNNIGNYQVDLKHIISFRITKLKISRSMPPYFLQK